MNLGSEGEEGVTKIDQPQTGTHYMRIAACLAFKSDESTTVLGVEPVHQQRNANGREMSAQVLARLDVWHSWGQSKPSERAGQSAATGGGDGSSIGLNFCRFKQTTALR